MKIATAFAAAIVAGACATVPSFALDKTDAFVAAAAQSNMSEISLSQLALQKSRNPRILSFAQHMIDDHTKAGTKLAIVARQDHVALPDAPDAEHASRLADLTARTGDFDRAYVDTMLADHVATIALFSDFADNGKDLYLKQFAQNTLPTLIAHKAMIETLQPKM